jgi:hypothetical protein
VGLRNYLIEGVSGSGKTTVCDGLNRRGFQAIHGDRVLAYQGNPDTGAPLPGFSHGNHIWDVDRVRALARDTTHPATYFCGGSRNHHRFIGLMDAVFVLDLDAGTLSGRLAGRGADEYGGTLAERAHVLHLLQTGEDLPQGAIRIDARDAPDRVVDAILAHCQGIGRA